MFPNLRKVSNLQKTIPSAFFMLAIASVMIGLTTVGSLASDAQATLPPVVKTEEPTVEVSPTPLPTKPTIKPVRPVGNPPTFEIGDGMAFDRYVVELSLAKWLFNETDAGGRRAIYNQWHSTIREPNYYISEPQRFISGEGTFSVPQDVWDNLRSSIVFYRVAAYKDEDPNKKAYSTTDAAWQNAPFVNRDAGDWVGLPMNSLATTTGGYSVVENGLLNMKAVSSDYGPRSYEGGTRFHPGLDIPVPRWTPIYAVSDGTLARHPNNSSVGRLDLSHNNGAYRTGYVHLEDYVISPNDSGTIYAGQLIGYSGDYLTNVNDDHLHLDTGYSSSQNYYNVLNYIPQTNNSNLYLLSDDNTHRNPIDVQPALGGRDQSSPNHDMALVGFGISSDYDMDLNLVRVQVGDSMEPGQYFELDYDEVIQEQNGLATLSNGSKFQIHWSDMDAYADSNLDCVENTQGFECGIFIQPTSTSQGSKTADYFYFLWDLSPFRGQEDSGPQRIRVGAEPVEPGKQGDLIDQFILIGPEVQPHRVDESSDLVQFVIDVTNHDVPNAEDDGVGGNYNFVKIELMGLPLEWLLNPWDYTYRDGMEIFPDPNRIPIEPGQTRTITIEINSPWISPEQIAESNTRIVATHGRFSTLQDTEVICEAPNTSASVSTMAVTSSISFSGALCPSPLSQVVITDPSDGDRVAFGSNVYVEAIAQGAPSGATATLYVESENSARLPISPKRQDGDDFTFKWTPAEPNTTYRLFVHVDGFQDSDIIEVSTGADATIIVPSGDTVDMDEDIFVKVQADDMYNVTLYIYSPFFSEEPDFHPLMNETSAGSGVWVAAEAWRPVVAGDEYRLHVSATPKDGSPAVIIEKTVIAIPEEPLIDVSDSIQLGEVTTVKILAPGAYDITLHADGTKQLVKAGYDSNTQSGDGIWEYNWTPNILGTQEIMAYVNYDFQETKEPRKTVQVVDKNTNEIVVNITAPLNGAEVESGKSTTVRVESPGELNKVELEITDPAGVKTVKTVTADDVGGNFTSLGIPWKATVTGVHTLKASGWNAAGQKGWTDPVIQVTVLEPDPVDPPDPSEQGTWTWINEWSFLWKNNKVIQGLHDNHYVGPHFYNTLIPHEEYVCGVIGVAGKGGDIGEKTEADPMDAYVTTLYNDETKSWQLMIDFNSLHKDLLGRTSERDEHWDVRLICFDRDVASEGGPQPDKPIFLKELYRYDSSVNESTGYRVDQYACGIVGYNSTAGDIDEHGAGDIFRNDLYDNNGVWWLRADFRTEGPHEAWEHTILCVDRDWAAMFTPEPGKPFVFTSYGNMGDNITKLTEFSTYEWTCGVVGYSALHGDIDEGEKGDNDNLLLAYMYEDYSLGKWRIRADFRSHKDSETWNADVMCVANNFDVAPIMTTAIPQLFTGEYDEVNHYKYGTGIHLEWTETRHPEAAYYEIRYTEDGARTWHTYNSRRDISYGGWINHHGTLDCGHNFKLCLQRRQSYHYQVRVLDIDGNPLTDWSDMIGMTAPDWPAHVEVTEPSPPGPYHSGATVTIYLKNSYGPDLDIEWNITDYNTASHNIISGCMDGPALNWESSYCELEIFNGSADASTNVSVGKLAALMPETSIHVSVIGRDSWGLSDSVLEVLEFERVAPFTIQSFEDVPPDHWAHTYVEDMADRGITSGCTTEGEAKYCPDGSLLRAQMAVFMVRSRHLDEPGYVPPSPEKVIFIDEEAEPLASVSSTSPNTAYRAALYYYDKYTQQLYDDGVITGCSSDPVKFCPNDVTTRAQMTVFIVRLLRGEEFTPPEPTQQTYSDAPLYNTDGERIWSGKWIEQATKDGLVQDCGTDMFNMLFRPEEAITRAEAACMMSHALSAKESGEG